MLRSLAIRNFVVVDALDVEFEPGLTCSPAKPAPASPSCSMRSGCCWRPLQLAAAAPGRRPRPNCRHVDVATRGGRRVAGEHELAADGDEVLLRAVLDAQGRSRALDQRPPGALASEGAGERLVDIHGQHARSTRLAEPERSGALWSMRSAASPTLAREVAERLPGNGAASACGEERGLRHASAAPY